MFCACDGKSLVVLDLPAGNVIAQVPLRGVPDVIFFDAVVGRIYVAVGDPGVIDVIDTAKIGNAILHESGGYDECADDPVQHGHSELALEVSIEACQSGAP